MLLLAVAYICADGNTNTNRTFCIVKVSLRIGGLMKLPKREKAQCLCCAMPRLPSIRAMHYFNHPPLPPCSRCSPRDSMLMFPVMR